MRTRFMAGLVALTLACAPDAKKAADSAFAEVQRRGESVMGVDQYTSQHVFEDLPDGGRIVLERDDAADTAAIRTTRSHMRSIELQFRAGNFAAPGLVHARDVPGTRVMSEHRSSIRYAVADLPRGAELRITSADSSAVSAVHQFLAFQRQDHRAAGHETH